MTHSQIPPHITLRECGDLLVKGKARTISKQLQEIADRNTLGRVTEYQDIFSHDGNVPRADYRKGISKEAV